ncbi:UNKNOWN [Stylonychia lemnae]|uniref:Uncharacterized protein n=1 Tax=Stylonychia lemnae TaxID=5949 RepID=A0A078B776_STYLE|nr:UNKNOWN [Stylonychia lemnae]|eukprot:CDW90046.1 UNKNOWN [Stylonychia lemnae]
MKKSQLEGSFRSQMMDEYDVILNQDNQRSQLVIHNVMSTNEENYKKLGQNYYSMELSRLNSLNDQKSKTTKSVRLQGEHLLKDQSNYIGRVLNQLFESSKEFQNSLEKFIDMFDTDEKLLISTLVIALRSTKVLDVMFSYVQFNDSTCHTLNKVYGLMIQLGSKGIIESGRDEIRDLFNKALSSLINLNIDEKLRFFKKLIDHSSKCYFNLSIKRKDLLILLRKHEFNEILYLLDNQLTVIVDNSQK